VNITLSPWVYRLEDYNSYNATAFDLLCERIAQTPYSRKICQLYGPRADTNK
jgi:hypothetical protein